jgi:hypothetical protein
MSGADIHLLYDVSLLEDASGIEVHVVLVDDDDLGHRSNLSEEAQGREAQLARSDDHHRARRGYALKLMRGNGEILSVRTHAHTKQAEEVLTWERQEATSIATAATSISNSGGGRANVVRAKATAVPLAKTKRSPVIQVS